MGSVRYELIQSRLTDLRSLINEKYQIADLAEAKGVDIGVTGQHRCCPFHNERTPSFVVDQRHNIWKCFGCGLGGGYLEFAYNYAKNYEQFSGSYSLFAEHLLKSDLHLQQLAGFKTIFRESDKVLDIFQENSSVILSNLFIQPKPEYKHEVTMKHLMDHLHTCDINTVMNFICDCEKGEPVAKLIDKYLYDHDININLLLEHSEEVFNEFKSILEEDEE